MERKLIASKKLTDTDLTWYNLYSDGYVEQGGQKDGVPKGYKDVSLPVEMANLSFVLSADRKSATATQNIGCWVQSPSTTGSTTMVRVYVSEANAGFFWRASGYAAESEYLDKIVRRQFIAY